MFIRMYILSFLRNVLIFVLITPMLTFYMLSLVYRVPNIDKEKILTYIIETGDMSILKTPIKEYFYFYAIVGDEGEIKYISDTSTLMKEKMRFLNKTIDVYYHGLKMQPFNVVPDDPNYHHYPVNEYYFTSKRVYDEKLHQSVFHVIYNIDEFTFGYNFQQSRKANNMAMMGASAISLIFAFLEVRPTRKAWYNQKQYIANMSHELRTPLSVINAVLELEEKSISDMVKNNDIIKKEMELLNNMVGDLMFLSRTDAKQIKVTKEECDIYLLLLESYISAEALGASKSITFQDFRGEEVVAFVDDKLLRQLMKILLSNAVEYTPEGGTVSLSLKKAGKKFEISVEDSGVGIPQKDRKAIFTRFYRVDKSQTSNKGNSGLGLAIARWIVKKHRGTICVESTLGKGSRFIVRLPIRS